MPLIESGVGGGLNSTAIKNSALKAAKLVMLEHQGAYPLGVEFHVVSREGAFSDTTIANYSARGNSSIAKYLLQDVSRAGPVFLKGELTTQYEGVTPKTLAFDIIYRADYDLKPSEIRKRVIILQSMCYPKYRIGFNPPLCMLHVQNLYSLEVYVQQVLVNWHNQWCLHVDQSEEDYGLPMGCDIAMTVMMHQYPTREEILCGAGFSSEGFTGKGYSADGTDGTTTLTREDKCVQELIERDKAYVARTTTEGQNRRGVAL